MQVRAVWLSVATAVLFNNSLLNRPKLSARLTSILLSSIVLLRPLSGFKLPTQAIIKIGRFPRHR